MTYVKQQTLRNENTLAGIGLHSGRYITMKISPADPDTGIVFVRTDLSIGKNTIPARWDYVADTRMCTVIANDHGASVGTIEHLMSALRGCGIDNALIEIDGPEVPAMDGSAMPFVDMIEKAGVFAQDAPRRMIRVLKEVSIHKDGKIVTLKPDNVSTFEGEIDFDHAKIGKQHFTTQLVNGNFKHDIASARTFGFKWDAAWLCAQGLGLGASLDNAIVLDEDSILNEKGLRFNDEFIRHKLLDAIGDLYLAGAQILGRYSADKGGHEINNAILHELFSNPDNWEYTTLGADYSHMKQIANIEHSVAA
jgi:UDP-3-O-[3-hydroxymyristoyl] N-acetylglucosamine deacetylase